MASGQSYLGTCAKCLGVISEKGCTAEKLNYHQKCFICALCSKELYGNPYYTMNGKAYCEEDYLSKLDKCASCNRPILKRILSNCVPFEQTGAEGGGSQVPPGVLQVCRVQKVFRRRALQRRPSEQRPLHGRLQKESGSPVCPMQKAHCSTLLHERGDQGLGHGQQLPHNMLPVRGLWTSTVFQQQWQGLLSPE
ncbi:LIM domain-containing protein 1 [Caerostris extrusa]|uniref:LIM domain-containing protein 1 n=1 Tax=Caerostris extrusa TaxID=172846 RepID=A0AAV4VFU6_CAEEX|nr:LIM domain-containing protein 1 [Caerostris extrusa]